MHYVMDIIMLFVLASLVVLVIMNPSGFAHDVASIGNFSLAQTSLFSGSNYNKTVPTLTG
jgi:hypothetical protein